MVALCILPRNAKLFSSRNDLSQALTEFSFLKSLLRKQKNLIEFPIGRGRAVLKALRHLRAKMITLIHGAKFLTSTGVGGSVERYFLDYDEGDLCLMREIVEPPNYKDQ
jgi:hypothetical protein